MSRLPVNADLFVRGDISISDGAALGSLPVVTFVESVELDRSHRGKLIVCRSNAHELIMLPGSSDEDQGITISIKNSGADILTVIGDGRDTVDGKHDIWLPVNSWSQFQLIGHNWEVLNSFARPTCGSIQVSGSFCWNLGVYTCLSLVLTGDCLLENPVNLMPGATYLLFLHQDAQGGRRVRWGSSYRWSDVYTPVMSDEPGSTYVFQFICDGNYLYSALPDRYS